MAVELAWPTTGARFRAMGTDCHIVVVGPGGAELTNGATARVEELERRWSRFKADSEISRLNLNPGRKTSVGGETLVLVELAVAAWQLTGGRFDPTMGHRLSELGYDRSFSDLAEATTTGDRSHAGSPVPSGDPGRIEIERHRRMITLPPGVGFDPGGIGKGLAADMITEEVMAAGAFGVMVSLGGDLRVRGVPPSGEHWIIAVAEPSVLPGTMATVALVDGGMATSTTAKRRWTTVDGRQHHLLDPETGRPDFGGPQLTSVIAGEAWWAEAVATAVTATGTRQGEDLPGCATLMVSTDGTVTKTGDFERYER